MLESLTIDNFLSFRDQTKFDFTATTEKPKKGSEHLEWYSCINKKKILKSIFLFGNNGSGKSNFLNAIAILRMFALNRRASKTSTNEELPDMHFKFQQECSSKPSSIEAVIHINQDRYIYCISWNTKTIVSETLKKQKGRKHLETVFSRFFDLEKDVTIIDFPVNSPISKEAQRIITENVICNTSVISVYDSKNFEAEDIAAIHNYFVRQTHFYGLDDGRLDLCQMLTRRKNPEQLHTILCKMLKCLGSNIKDFKVDTTRKKIDPDFAEFLRHRLTPEEYNERYPDDMHTEQYLRFAHTCNDEIVNSNDPYIWLTEAEESQGTINMIRLMIILFDTAQSGTLTTIDECAMGIHQETFNRIIQFYLSISRYSQVFLATQALPILEMDGYRRDTARFFDKDFETGISNVSSVDLRKFHANKNIYKNYVNHAFGGKPSIPSPEEWQKLLNKFQQEFTTYLDE